jgi:hypothetical protein
MENEMNPVDYIYALTEIQYMKALNREREAQGYAPVYSEADFLAVIDRYGHHLKEE